MHAYGHRRDDGGLSGDLRQLCRSCDRADIDAAEREIRRAKEAEQAAVVGIAGSRKSPLHDALWWGRSLRPVLSTHGEARTVAWAVKDLDVSLDAVRGEIVLRLSRAGLAGADTAALASAISDLLDDAGVPDSDEAYVARRMLSGYRTATGRLLGPLPGLVSGTKVVPGVMLTSDAMLAGRLRVHRDGRLEAIGAFEPIEGSSTVSVSVVAAAARLLDDDDF